MSTDWAGCEENREHLTQLLLHEWSLILLLLKDGEIFFFQTFFCLNILAEKFNYGFEVLLKESPYWQTVFFSILSENGMTRNTPKLNPGSWDYFSPSAIF